MRQSGRTSPHHSNIARQTNIAAACIVGVDLGKLQDYTAISVLVRIEDETLPRGTGDGFRPLRPHEAPRRHFKEYQLRHVERLPLGTAYRRVAERARELAAKAAAETGAPVRTAIDFTGVGVPVFEMMQEEGIRPLAGISIHGGDSVSRDGPVYRVPKRDLVAVLQVHLQNGTLAFAEGLKHAPELKRELQNFKAKINIATGHDSYEAWREGDHDDLVLALAIGVWYAERPRELRLFY